MMDEASLDPHVLAVAIAPRLWRFTERRGLTDWEDLAQTALVRLLERRGTFADERHAYNWCCTVALNLARDYQRDRAWRFTPLDEAIGTTSDDPAPLIDARLDASARITRLASDLATAPAHYRDAVFGPALAEMTLADYSRAHGVHRKTLAGWRRLALLNLAA